MKKQIFLFLLVILLFCACTFEVVGEFDSGELLFVDDFSTPNLQWDVWKREDGTAIGYHEDGLAFVINSADTDSISLTNRIFSDARIEVVTRNLNGLPNNGFGVVCRAQDQENYYAFLVSSDGYYGIIRVLYGGYAVLNGGALQYAEDVYQQDELNHIRADCVGDELTLYLNNTELVSVEDDVFSEGLVGLTASSFEDIGVAIWFDNFMVLQP